MAGLWDKLMTARLWLKRIDKTRMGKTTLVLIKKRKNQTGMGAFQRRYSYRAWLDVTGLTIRFQRLFFNYTRVKTNSKLQKNISFYECEVKTGVM